MTALLIFLSLLLTAPLQGWGYGHSYRLRHYFGFGGRPMQDDCDLGNQPCPGSEICKCGECLLGALICLLYNGYPCTDHQQCKSRYCNVNNVCDCIPRGLLCEPSTPCCSSGFCSFGGKCPFQKEIN